MEEHQLAADRIRKEPLAAFPINRPKTILITGANRCEANQVGSKVDSLTRFAVVYTTVVSDLLPLVYYLESPSLFLLNHKIPHDLASNLFLSAAR